MKLTRRGKAVSVLVVILVLVATPALAAYVYLVSIGVYGKSEPGRLVDLVIPKGATPPEIARMLEEKDVIESARGFRIAMFLHEGEERIEAGRYQLYAGLTATDALDALLEGALGERFVEVTFPEGSWLSDFARILDEKTHISGEEFLELVTSGKLRSSLAPEDVDTMEGLLFPSTYQIVKRDDARSVAERLIEQFEQRAAQIDFSANMQALGYTPYEGVIVASMIESEARVPEELPMVARVIYNRLEEGMTLGIDATVIYALGEHKEFLTESDLAIDSPYNTRLVPGLPPTPIGASGLPALKAASNPAEGDWLFYVLSDCDGRHSFSVDYDDFLADKRAYQALDCG